MFADSYILPQCIVQPGSFGALMALYEANYIKLDALVGEIGAVGECRLSTCAEDMDLFLWVESRTR